MLYPLHRRTGAVLRAIVALVLAGVTLGLGWKQTSAPADSESATNDASRTVLPAVSAIGFHLDTLLIGGYASGGFRDAVRTVASDLADYERELIGEHLDRIFGKAALGDGLGSTGRLRLAYERMRRPDGSTRSIRVLGAEVAAAGRVHTAYFFEAGRRPGYYDPHGRPLDGDSFIWPIRGARATSTFAARRLHPILGRVLPHTGIDLAAPAGTPIRAAAAGVVTEARSDGGYGLLVELQHANGYVTRYAHLSRFEPGIEHGRLVGRGDVIGSVGMTGTATGPHLHFEVLRGGRAMDPSHLSVSTGLSESGVDRRWLTERHAIAALLARAPTITVIEGDGSSAGT